MEKRTKINDLFGSMRMVLPEQREAYLKFKREQSFVPKPDLEYDEIAEINDALTNSKRYSWSISLRVWQPINGDRVEIGEVTGVVRSVDPMLRQVKVVHADGTFTWVDLWRIAGVA
ncbi:YolD-like family protein [Brevibacillus laterosporus]|uniref:YolD-like family protein n=1 Tax=Brevibacillus laterosporus TaxID=1465 RepID=UPI000EAD4760|nr:YolD-like family protein [Brevibacillus laterosporus]AYK07794.1 YolD-like family protein [Brevibacillus laterosporus]